MFLPTNFLRITLYYKDWIGKSYIILPGKIIVVYHHWVSAGRQNNPPKHHPLNRLYEWIETRDIQRDDSLEHRIRNNQYKRQEIFAEIARVEKEVESELDKLGPENVDLFCKALKSKLRDSSSTLGKNYLKLPIEDITVEGNEVRITGSYAALLEKTKAGDSLRAPTFGVVWLPLLGSNQRQSD